MTSGENNTKRVFGIGTVVIDHVLILSRYPSRDTKCVAEGQWRQVGGPVPVALSTASFYGARTHFFGRWGDDDAGEEVRNRLSSRGVDLRANPSHPEWSTGFSHVWTETAEAARTIAYSRGDFPVPNESDVSAHANVLGQCEILHLDGWAPLAARWAASRMKERGGLVVLDAGSKKPGMEELLPFVDVLIASNLFCQAWFGTQQPTLDALSSLQCETVVRTMGADGATCYDSEGEYHVPGRPVNAIDTNGAGDIFAGALLAGLVDGRTVRDCLSFANSVAAASCQHRGNFTLPDRQEVDELDSR